MSEDLPNTPARLRNAAHHICASYSVGWNRPAATEDARTILLLAAHVMEAEYDFEDALAELRHQYAKGCK